MREALFWFFLLWALLVPYLFDSAHRAACDREGWTNLTSLADVLDGGTVYLCHRAEWPPPGDAG